MRMTGYVLNSNGTAGRRSARPYWAQSDHPCLFNINTSYGYGELGFSRLSWIDRLSAGNTWPPYIYVRECMYGCTQYFIQGNFASLLLGFVVYQSSRLIEYLSQRC